MWASGAVTEDDRLDRAEVRQVMRRAIRMARPQRRLAMATVGFVVLSTSATVVGPLLLRYGIDDGIRVGDVVVGMASYGQATYETEYNGGMGSNGLTSARHDVFHKALATKYPESFDASVPDDLVYSGKYALTDVEPETGMTVGKLVLSPTRTYAPVIKKLLDTMPREDVHGMVHCSGGAQSKVGHFLRDGLHVIKDDMLPVPPLFRLIQECSGTDWGEMYKVFNCGHRMEVYCDPKDAAKVIEASESFGIPAKIVGRVEACEGKSKVTVKSEHGEFTYDSP